MRGFQGDGCCWNCTRRGKRGRYVGPDRRGPCKEAQTSVLFRINPEPCRCCHQSGWRSHGRGRCSSCRSKQGKISQRQEHRRMVQPRKHSKYTLYTCRRRQNRQWPAASGARSNPTLTYVADSPGRFDDLSRFEERCQRRRFATKGTDSTWTSPTSRRGSLRWDSQAKARRDGFGTQWQRYSDSSRNTIQGGTCESHQRQSDQSQWHGSRVIASHRAMNRQ